MMLGGSKDYDNEQLLHQMVPAALVLPHPTHAVMPQVLFCLRNTSKKKYCHTYLKKKSLQVNFSAGPKDHILEAKSDSLTFHFPRSLNNHNKFTNVDMLHC